MPDKKIEKALYGPSTVEVALGAVLGLSLGVAVACVYLVFKPVQTVKEMPAEPERGVVYHVPGKTDAVKGRGWQNKLSAFLAGHSIILTEEEMNAWASGAAEAGGAGAPAANKDDFVQAGVLNFRLEGDRLHVSVRVVLNYYGLSKEVVMQSAGGFVRDGNTFVFSPEKLYLGSCPLHVLPGATGALARTVARKQPIPDEFRAAWAKVTAIGVEGSLLKVTTQP